MKRKPIKAKLFLGGTCSYNYEKLPEEYDFYGAGVHFYNLKIDDKYIELDDTTLKEVFEKYKEEFKKAELVEISICTPLHNEIYELCKENNKFLLVEQGNGYV